MHKETGEVLTNLSSLPLTKEAAEPADFKRGLKLGIPIALGYVPVAFTFGLMAVQGGIPIWIVILISLTNLTSAGQFAGVGLIIANASLFEIAVTTFVINIRYLLMSLSLSQRIVPMPLINRAIMAFGITDETFAVASMEKREITFPYMLGLISCPYFGWALGTALGALTTALLPPALQSAMGIALYAMFIALFVPPAMKSKAVFTVVLIAVALSSAFSWVPYLKNHISAGWSIIITTIGASTLGAIFFPRKENQ